VVVVAAVVLANAALLHTALPNTEVIEMQYN